MMMTSDPIADMLTRIRIEVSFTSQTEGVILLKDKIGRASCRERVSSPV